MVNELKELLREASARPPQESNDIKALVGAGRRRVRVRRAVTVGGTALAAGAVTLGSMAWLNPTPADLAAAGIPRPSGPRIDLRGAQPAVEGTDYRDVTSYTNKDLDSDNGEYFDGVTDDGLVLFREGQTMTRPKERLALMDPATGEKQWLPDPPGNDSQAWPIELSEDRLVLMWLAHRGSAGRANLELSVYDRAAGSWTAMSWPGLPDQLRLPARAGRARRAGVPHRDDRPR